jgi:hypothetical protein
MGDFYSPLNITQIAGQPHDIPDKAIDKLPIFTGTDAITVAYHLKAFSKCTSGYVRDPAHKHDDVYMKLLALSLDGDAGDWFIGLPANSFATLTEFKTAFTNKYGEKKEPRHQLAALTNIKRSDMQTMEEFNKKFTDLYNAIPTDYKPTPHTILVYYIEALSGEMQYELRDKEPTTLLEAQTLATKIDKNMQSSGKSNLPGYSRAQTPLKTAEPKDKDPLAALKDSYKKKMMDMCERMEKAE